MSGCCPGGGSSPTPPSPGCETQQLPTCSLCRSRGRLWGLLAVKGLWVKGLRSSCWTMMGWKWCHGVLCVRSILELEEEGRRKHRTQKASARVLLHSRQQVFVLDHVECWVLSPGLLSSRSDLFPHLPGWRKLSSPAPQDCFHLAGRQLPSFNLLLQAHGSLSTQRTGRRGTAGSAPAVLVLAAHALSVRRCICVHAAGFVCASTG